MFSDSSALILKFNDIQANFNQNRMKSLYSSTHIFNKLRHMSFQTELPKCHINLLFINITIANVVHQGEIIIRLLFESCQLIIVGLHIC